MILNKNIINFVNFIFCIMSLCSCTDIGFTTEKKKLIPKDFRLFQGTEAWPLAKAAMKKDYKSMDSLISENPEIINIRDSIYGNSMLMLAIFNLDYKLFKTIIKYNPEINYYNSWQESPIYEASRYKDSEVRFIADLLKMGANINDTIYNEDRTKIITSPLCDAVGFGNKEVINFLIEKGANIDFESDFGITPLGSAIASEKFDVALVLLNNGADYSKSIFKNVDKKGNLTIPNNILQMLRKALPDPFTKSFSQKKEVISFLKNKGLDYESEPIPEYILKQIKSKYGIFWKIYAEYY